MLKQSFGAPFLEPPARESTTERTRYYEGYGRQASRTSLPDTANWPANKKTEKKPRIERSN